MYEDHDGFDQIHRIESEESLPPELLAELDASSSSRIAAQQPEVSTIDSAPAFSHGLESGYVPFYSHVGEAKLSDWRGWNAEEKLLAELPSTPTRQAVDDLLVFLSELGIDDIVMTVGSGISIKLDGNTHVITKRSVSLEFVAEFLRRVRGVDSVDSKVRSGEPDTFAYTVAIDTEKGKYARYRFIAVSNIDPHGGYDSILLVGRSLPACPLTVEELDLPSEVVDIFESGKGVVWITGETGSGKTTTLGAIVRKRVEGEGGNLITFEDPAEYIYATIPNKARNVVVSQVQVGAGVKSWEVAASSALRLNPDVVIFGECRDAATMSTCLLMGKTGHIVYSTLHTKGVPDFVARMMDSLDASGAAFDRANFSNNVISNTLGVVHQRLLPKQGGGRVAVFEYLKLTQELREEIMDIPPEGIYTALNKAVERHGRPLSVDVESKKDLIEPEAYKSTMADLKTRGEHGL